MTCASPVDFVVPLHTMGQIADMLRNADNAECLLTEIFKICMRIKILLSPESSAEKQPVVRTGTDRDCTKICMVSAKGQICQHVNFKKVLKLLKRIISFNA